MKTYIGFGSNLGDRAENLENAAKELSLFGKILRASPVFENPALLSAGAPAEWNHPFLNSAIEFEFDGTAHELLKLLKAVEQKLGRQKTVRWAPRLIDLDLLIFGTQIIQEENLQIPHPGLVHRAFVLGPLTHLVPNLLIPGTGKTVLQLARSLKNHSPLWMGILNLTPDSFSETESLLEIDLFKTQFQVFQKEFVHVFDLGAESTRPGATALDVQAEWDRLRAPLEVAVKVARNTIFRPLISVDTRHAQTARRALMAGADWINDVSGVTDPKMLSVLKEFGAPFVAMHSIGIPADPALAWPKESDPIHQLRYWAQEKIKQFLAAGISMDNIILDPGIGFGKTPQHSLLILRRIKELEDLPVRWLVGHSKKSFMKIWSAQMPHARVAESIGLSLRLVENGVDILRVHNPETHIQAHLAWTHAGEI